jgi:hypothetical protein
VEATRLRHTSTPHISVYSLFAWMKNVELVQVALGDASWAEHPIGTGIDWMKIKFLLGFETERAA